MIKDVGNKISQTLHKVVSPPARSDDECNHTDSSFDQNLQMNSNLIGGKHERLLPTEEGMSTSQLPHSNSNNSNSNIEKVLLSPLMEVNNSSESNISSTDQTRVAEVHEIDSCMTTPSKATLIVEEFKDSHLCDNESKIDESEKNELPQDEVSRSMEDNLCSQAEDVYRPSNQQSNHSSEFKLLPSSTTTTTTTAMPYQIFCTTPTRVIQQPTLHGAPINTNTDTACALTFDLNVTRGCFNW